MKRLLCFLTKHHFTPWRLCTAFFGREVAKDATRRECKLCGRVESQIIPFKRFQIK